MQLKISRRRRSRRSSAAQSVGNIKNEAFRAIPTEILYSSGGSPTCNFTTVALTPRRSCKTRQDEMRRTPPRSGGAKSPLPYATNIPEVRELSARRDVYIRVCIRNDPLSALLCAKGNPLWEVGNRDKLHLSCSSATLAVRASRARRNKKQRCGLLYLESTVKIRGRRTGHFRARSLSRSSEVDAAVTSHHGPG